MKHAISAALSAARLLSSIRFVRLTQNVHLPIGGIHVRR